MAIELFVNSQNHIAKIEPTLFGSFVEHLGRCVYQGIFQPGHPAADSRGIRQDVVQAVKDLHVTLLRYPGGNFVSNFNWKDSVGPVRREMIDPAWFAIDPNTFGLDEFAYFCNLTNTQIFQAVNLGTGTIKEAQELVEYCNLVDQGPWAKARISNGRKNPYGIHYWCLGNEMDGEWQTGTKTAAEYGEIAAEAAKLMKWVDPSICVSACGSCSPVMPTYPEWDRIVLEKAYSQIDFLSLHLYFTYRDQEHNLDDYLACGNQMEAYINTVVSTVNYVRALKRSNKFVHLSIDEWNVWHTFDGSAAVKEKWKTGSPLLENHYDFADALVVAEMLSIFMNHADVVKIACLAQLVNAIAPIITDPQGGIVKQTIFYPFQMAASVFAGKTALHVVGQIPSAESKTYGRSPLIRCVFAYDSTQREYAAYFVNLSAEEQELLLHFDQPVSLQERVDFRSEDLHAKNTFEHPDAVVAKAVEVISEKSEKASLALTPYSLSVVRFHVLPTPQ